MSTQLILQVALQNPLRTLFDYYPPLDCQIEKLEPGIRICVPFRSNHKIGVLINKITHSNLKTEQIKTAITCLDEKPLLDKEQLDLIEFLTQYYHHPIGEIVTHTLPKWLRDGKNLPSREEVTVYFNKKHSKKSQELQKKLALNQEQTYIFNKVLEQFNNFHVDLIEGITGSGKTEIYLHLIEEMIVQQQKQALVLVPEIALTPQTISRFEQRFNLPILAFHSDLTEKQKLYYFAALYYGFNAIVIGTRSSVFLPLPKLGLIIVDEEHDTSYKQHDGFRYHARDVAIIRAKHKNVPIILGTATPSMESLLRAEQHKYTKYQLTQRAGLAKKPQISLIDLNKSTQNEGLSDGLLDTMHLHLARQEQVLLFLNRRGYAPSVFCPSCHFRLICRICSVPCVYHQNKNLCICHHCGSEYQFPDICPECQQSSLLPIGIGTERIEAALKKHFPTYEILRMDRDTISSKRKWDEVLEKIHNHEAHILLGTQMIAKGHHFPNVTLVGILNMDQGFLSTDFRSIERIGQLIIQVAGRAGREELNGKVLLQTYFPEHPYLGHLLRQDYENFAKSLLAQRKLLRLPPYTYSALLRAESKSSDILVRSLRQIKRFVNDMKIPSLEILGPAPALIEKKSGRFRYQLFLVSLSRASLHHAIKHILSHFDKNKIFKTFRWSIDVDPLDMY